MVEYIHNDLNATYAALADPSRRAILSRLRAGELRVTQIYEPFDISLNAVSKHLKTLEKAGLVRRSIRGRDHYFELIAEPLMEASDWIESYRTFWELRLNALESFLENQQEKPQRDEMYGKP